MPPARPSPSMLRRVGFPLAVVGIIAGSMSLYRAVLDKRQQDQRARRKDYPNPI